MSRPRVALHGRLIALAVLASMLSVVGIGSPAVAAQQYQSVELPAAPPSEDGQIAVMVELNELPAARVYANVLEKRTRGKAVSAVDRQAAVQEAAAAGKLQVARVLDEQAAIAGRLAAAAPGAVELYRVQKAFNGIALLASAEQMEALKAVSGVRSVSPIQMDVPTNSTSVPFLGTPKVWDAINSLGLGLNADGSGIRIGIIDTGIDYLHADFGGTGLAADYTTEKADTANFTTVGTAAGGSFPTAKVVGGTDFVGDAYNGSTVPVPTPDPNPMDCFGHGSHVSGTAAGFGVTSAGTAYAGPYTPAAVPTIKTLRIGPGTAPKALLYALRVFGCGGSTAFTTAAIDWAMDPNGDNDLSDHLDVINMSLGSNFGSRLNSTSVASDNAAAAGVIVVASAGNAGDSFFITGAPGAGTRVVSTAASIDSGVSFGAFGTLRVNAPAGIAGSFLTGTATAFADGPPPGGLTANVVIALDPADGAGPSTTDGCSPLTNAAAVAGNIAIVDRGTCGFAVKAKNAQNAGAVGVIIANSASAFGNMAGFDETVTIPTVIVQQADGNTLKANVAGLNVTLWSSADVLASFSSRGPRRASSPVRLKPDIAAPGLFINSAQTGVTCTGAQGCLTPNASGFLTGSQILNISGTSMASPHMAGIMALLRQLHPDWTVEELKALAMNYATADVFNDHDGNGPRNNPSRIGAGRVLPAASAAAPVIAMDTDVAGGVSVSFDTEVLGASTQVATVRVVNHGITSQTYDLAFDTVIDAPGVGFSLPDGSSVTVPAGDTVEFHVQMDANASLMNHTLDPLLSTTQLPAGGVGTATGPVSRPWLTEESAYVTFKQSGNLKLRLPVYMASRPASAMTGPATITAAATSIPLSGTGVCTGTLGAGPTCSGSFPSTEVSLVSPFELQVVSPASPGSAPPYADIQYAGVSYNPSTDMLQFGISTVGDWSSLNEVSFNVCIDNNEDGVYDFLIFNTNGGTLGGSTTPQDSFMMGIRNLSTGATSFTLPPIPPNVQFPSVIESAHFLNNVIVLPMARTLLGFVGADKGFRWKVVTCPGGSSCARSTTGDHCSPAAGTFFDSANGPYFFDGAAPGLNFNGATLQQDLNGASIPVTVNTANMTTNGSLGALLLHHHNTAGTRAEVVLLDTAQRADLAITKSASSANPGLGQNVTYTLTVTNNGPNDATGIQVDDFPPLGTTYVSDDGGGAYNSSLGIWTVGALANGASATLHLTVRVDVSDQVCNLAQITAGSPLDPNPANNQAESCLQAPRTADLAVTVTRTSAATVNPGGTVTWQVTVTNKGQDPAYALTTSESFSPVAVTAGGATPTAGVFIPGATGNWKVSSLGPGVTQTLQYSITAPNMAGTLTNTVTAASTKALRLPGKAFDPNLPNNTGADTVTVLSPATVSATKTVSGSFVEGGAVTYTVVLSNSGAFDQQDNLGHELTDVLPSQLTLVSASATSGTAVATVGTNTVTWDGAIPASGSVTLTINATIKSGTALQTVTNQANVSFDADGNGINEAAALSNDPNAGNGSNPTSFLVRSPASVTATKTVSGSFVEGGAITYTVVLSNSSSSAQQDNPGHELTDVLPSQLTLVSASATSGTAVATVGTNTVTWDGVVPANGSVTLTIHATVKTGTALQTVTNQATVNYDADGNGTNEATAASGDPGAGGGATSFVVVSPASIGTHTKTVSGTFADGGTVTYTVTISNPSANTQLDNPGDELTDVLPAGLTLVSASATSGTAVADVPNNTVHWNGTIAGNGGTVTITITALVNNGAGGQAICNQGTIFFDADGNGTNESSILTDDPSAAGVNDPTCFRALTTAQVPTLSSYGLALLALLLVGGALLVLRRRQA